MMLRGEMYFNYVVIGIDRTGLTLSDLTQL